MCMLQSCFRFCIPVFAAGAMLLVAAAGPTGSQEQAPTVTPGIPGTVNTPGTAPSDAVILLGPGTGWDAWTRSHNGDPAAWTADENGIGQVKPGTGSVRTKNSFGDCHIHVEWQIPKDRVCRGQAGCNSGVYIMGRYEVQILGVHGNETYPGGSAGAWYNQYPPLANPCRPNGQWNIYDILFRAPRVDADGNIIEKPRGTVIFNGVVVQYDAELNGPTGAALLKGNAESGPLFLQDHGDPIRFANVWIRPLKSQKPM